MKPASAFFIRLLLGVAATSPIHAEEPAVMPRSLAYVLQAEHLAPSRRDAVRTLTDCGRDWIVVDLFFEGGAGGAYSAGEIEQIRGGCTGRRVLTYLSIGEAEDYRPYWNTAWDADRDGRPEKTAPSWLGRENPDWKGNYRVRYWDAAWQDQVLGLLDQAIRVGFNGVYLDLVDAFESFEYDPVAKDWMDGRVNPETGHTYRDDMIRWVRRIADYARNRKPGFLVIPQNGAQLLEKADYLTCIDAIGIEDLFTDGNRPQKREHIRYVTGFLDAMRGLGKPIFVIEYATQPALRRAAIRQASERGYLLLLTDRDLKSLGNSAPSPDTGNELPD